MLCFFFFNLCNYEKLLLTKISKIMSNLSNKKQPNIFEIFGLCDRMCFKENNTKYQHWNVTRSFCTCLQWFYFYNDPNLESWFFAYKMKNCTSGPVVIDFSLNCVLKTQNCVSFLRRKRNNCYLTVFGYNIAF